MTPSLLHNLLRQSSAQIPNCVMNSIVDATSGMALVSASLGTDPHVGASADAYHTELYRLVTRSMDMLDASQQARGIVLTGPSLIFYSLPFPGSPYFWHVVTSTDTMTGFTQAVMRKFQAPLWESMSQLLD